MILYANISFFLLSLRILRCIRCVSRRSHNCRIPACESIFLIGIRIGLGRRTVRIYGCITCPDSGLGQFGAIIIQPGDCIIGSIRIIRCCSQPVIQADFALSIPCERCAVYIINTDVCFQALAIVMAHISDRVVMTRISIGISRSQSISVNAVGVLFRKSERTDLLDINIVNFPKYNMISLCAVYSFKEVLKLQAFLNICLMIEFQTSFPVLQDLERSDSQSSVLIFKHQHVAKFYRRSVRHRI